MGTTRGYSPHLKNQKGQNGSSQAHFAWCTDILLGLSERIGRIVRGARIGVAYKPPRTICNVISKLKDPISTGDKSGVIYHSSYKNCDQFYIGEAGRNLKQRRGEHDRAIRLGKVSQSAISRHCLQCGHKFDFDGTRVLDTTSNK